MNELVLFYPRGHEAHAEFGHPERPERVEALRNALREEGIWEEASLLEPAPLGDEILENVHHPAYLKHLKAACQSGQRLDMDTYITPASWQLALNAAGGAVAVARSVWRRDSRRGFALTRPPGHHATPSRGMGFCLLNNVAIAAEYLLSQEGATRVAIVDLDLHHGNGTQDVFYERDDVLYISTHQFPHYPGSGALTETGIGTGRGATANFPLPPMAGDRAFKAVLEEAILPLLNCFKPEMILVSYGFDSHWRDPLGSLTLSAAGYGELVARLTAYADQCCDGKIALFLEGGYDLEAGAACTRCVVCAMLGRACEDPLGPSPDSESSRWQLMLQQAKTIWGL